MPADRLRSALAFNYGAYQLAGIVGPALGGLLVGDDRDRRQLPGRRRQLRGRWPPFATAAGAAAAAAGAHHPPILHSIAEGLRFVGRTRALAGSFAIDLMAMTFGWPRAMLAVLSVSVYGTGARGTGLLFAAMALGGTLSVASAGWIEGARRLGRIVLGVVVVWGLAIAGVGLSGSLAARDGLPGGGRVRRRGQRRLPLRDQPDRDPGRAARADERGLQPGRHRRARGWATSRAAWWPA